MLKTLVSLLVASLLLSLTPPGVPGGAGLNVGGAGEPLSSTAASVSEAQTSAANGQQQQQPARGRRALLVGISKYRKSVKDGLSWDDLEGLSATNDIQLLAKVLVRRYQFRPEDIKVISDEPVSVDGKVVPPVRPSHDEIVNTFRSFLTERTRPGDVAFFHFSGHGQRVPDNGTDELDGYDETLVPADYVSTSDATKNIRDDEIGVLLGELSAKNPSTILVSIDSCFSGTATRGDYDGFRGGPWRGAPVPPEKVRGEDESLNDASNFSGGDARPLRNYIFLSAAGPQQKAVYKRFCTVGEGCKYYGVYTRALAAAMVADTTGPATTYRDIYERVRSAVAGDQDQEPQVEGDQLDHVFLRDGALPAESYIPVAARKSGRGEFLLSAGALQGVTVGSKFALYPAGTKSRSEGKPLAEAKVVEVGDTYATLRTDAPVTAEAAKNAARAFEVLHNYESVLKVALKDAGGFEGLSDMLKQLGLVTTVPEADPTWNVLIRAVVQADRDEGRVPLDFRGVILQRRNGRSVIAKVADGKELPRKVRDALVSEAKRVTLVSLANTAPNIKIEMRLVPVEVEKWRMASPTHAVIEERSAITDKKEGIRYSKGGSIEFRLNDWYRVEVRNSSDSDVYVTILQLGADGRISPFFPRLEKNNLIITAKAPAAKNDGWMRIEGPYVRVSGPPGVESLHAIATREPANFSPLFDPGLLSGEGERGLSFTERLRNLIAELKGRRSDGEAALRVETALASPLGQIFVAEQEGRGVRGPGSSMPPPSWSTATVSYLIVR
jgi:hypothetical protein